MASSNSAYICMQSCYLETMALVQVRDVPEVTVARLKALAQQKGITMAAFIREELERIAQKPTNAEVIADIVADNKARAERGDPISTLTKEEIVRAIRELRDNS
jgi:predicted DNA-binding protein